MGIPTDVPSASSSLTIQNTAELQRIGKGISLVGIGLELSK